MITANLTKHTVTVSDKPIFYAETGSGPAVVMLHGFGNNKREWESLTDRGDGGDKYNWNTHWFAKHGYYVLTYTPRGFVDPGPDAGYQPSTPGGSSGQPPNDARGTIHLKSRDTEIKDTQWLAALVADSFADVGSSHVAVTGGSYGGGESWLQASQAQNNTARTPATSGPSP